MKRYIVYMVSLVLCISFFACSNSNENKESVSASSIAQKWCELNGRVAIAKTANDDVETEKAEAAMESFEKQLEFDYKDDKAFLKKIENEIEKCEDDSEGR